MTIIELLRSIETHLLSIMGGTPLAGKVGPGQRARINANGRSAVTTAGVATASIVAPVEGDVECLECNSGLFLFYRPATVVRWPSPTAGNRENSLIRVTAVRPQDTVLSDVGVDGFTGEFSIDVNGRLFIHPGNGQIDIVVLGNPGGEWGSNTNC